MTIYSISIISSTGYPYFNLEIKNLPQNLKLFLRFFDYTKILDNDLIEGPCFELNAGLVSALGEVAKTMNKRMKTLEFVSKGDCDLLTAL